MKKLLFVLSFIALACSPAREDSTERAYLKSTVPLNQKVNAKQSPLKNTNVSSSVRVDSLAQDSSAKSRLKFLHASEGRDGVVVGRVEIAANPFIQFALSSEKFKRDDLKTFIAQVEEARKNGEVSTVQWAAFVAARTLYQTTGSEWGIRKFQTKAINQKIAATFPGVFGGVNPIEKSLPYLLLRKFDGDIDPASSQIQKTLAASLPVLCHDEFVTDVRESLAAAINHNPFSRLSETDQTPSFILIQRLFAQLLSLKGYNYAKYTVNNEGSAIPLLTGEQDSFKSGVRAGQFFDPKLKKRISLTAEMISSYDPASQPYFLSTCDNRPANLDEELSVMAGTALAFEASSPAAYFVNGPKDYWFGDVTSPNNKAIAPSETHSLAFGLTIMNFKNIAARRLAMIDENGRDVKVTGKEIAGIALLDQVGSQKIVTLANVLKLIELNLQLDAAVAQVLRKASENSVELKSMNSFYGGADNGKAVLAGMSELRSKLRDLRFPLYLLTMRLVRSNTEQLTWNPDEGFVPPSHGGISKQRKQYIGSVLLDLGAQLDQPLIIEIGNRLANGRDL